MSKEKLEEEMNDIKDSNNEEIEEEQIEDKKHKKKNKNNKRKKRESSSEKEEEEKEKSESSQENKTKKKSKKKSKKGESNSENEDDDDSEDSFEEYKRWKKQQKMKKKKQKTKKQKSTNKEDSVTNKPSNTETNEISPENCFAAPLNTNKLTPDFKEESLDELVYLKIISQIGEYLKIFLKFQSFFPEFRKENNIKLIAKFISRINKYCLFFNIKRFAIPCFGTISCGKSSFLNYLLKLHKILETDEDIATKFVCFIRHSKKLKMPKIYSVKFEPRDSGKFNFEKDKEIKGDVKEIIKERNKFIREGNGKRDPSNYFLIVETNIPIFHHENEKYAPYFEFLDFPGLDEVKLGEDTLKENTYFKDFIPLIQPNILFSLFLFDLNSYESTSGKEIFKNYIFNKDEYISTKLKETLNDSLYILNQIDKELKQEKDKNKRIIIKEKREEHFREKMKENFEKELKIKNVNFSEENSLSISAKILELEEYKLESFKQFIEYIISLEEIEDERNFKNYLDKKMKQILNILKFDRSKKCKEEIEDEEIDEELDEINELLKNVHLVGNNFKLDEYYYYRQLFEKNVNNIKETEENKEISILIINKIKKAFNNFFDLNEFSKILTYIENNSKELMEYSKKINKNISNLTKNPNSIEHPIKLLELLLEKLINFLLINKESKTINILVSNTKMILNYIKNQMAIRILFIGRHSSGKTSLINSFLGIDLLETSSEECTMDCFIIKYMDNIEETSIYKAEMIKNNFGYFYFEKNNLLAKGVLEVKNKIAHINKQKKSRKNQNQMNQKYLIIILLKCQ